MVRRHLARTRDAIGRTLSGSRHQVSPTRSLFPSIGFFGGVEADHWAIELGRPTHGLRLSLPSDQARALHFRGVELDRDGDRTWVRSTPHSVALSTPTSGPSAAAVALRLNGVISEPALGPWPMPPPIQNSSGSRRWWGG